MANLIDLKEFNTILVLHDQTTRHQINMLIEILQPRNDIAWILVNEFDNPKYWKNTINQKQNQLILTALQTKDIYPTLKRLYDKKSLNKRSKNIIVLGDNFDLATQILRSFSLEDINAVLVFWTSDEAVLSDWNPFSATHLVKLNDTEYLR